MGLCALRPSGLIFQRLDWFEVPPPPSAARVVAGSIARKETRHAMADPSIKAAQNAWILSIVPAAATSIMMKSTSQERSQRTTLRRWSASSDRYQGHVRLTIKMCQVEIQCRARPESPRPQGLDVTTR
jgi:hypothetical protein